MRWLTRTQTALVDPGVHLAALRFQLLDVCPHIGELVLHLLELGGVRANSLVESASEKVRHWL